MFSDDALGFFLSDPNIDDDDQASDSHWEFQRPLGSGSFGIVALWRKGLNEYCAIKDAGYRQIFQYETMPRGVVMEAV